MKRLGISGIQYLILEVAWQTDGTFDTVINALNIGPFTIVSQLGGAQPAIATAGDDRIIFGPKWEKYKKNEDIAMKVMDYLNKRADKRFSTGHQLIEKLAKKGATFEQFCSIIEHKTELWGEDEKMRQYLTPSTLFGSKQKFDRYLDEATNYWIEKKKRWTAQQN